MEAHRALRPSRASASVEAACSAAPWASLRAACFFARKGVNGRGKVKGGARRETEQCASESARYAAGERSAVVRLTRSRAPEG
jgi:hypothetical protein